MRKSLIAIRLAKTDYQGLVDLANTVATALTGNVNFATPAIPVLDISAAALDVENAIAAWGPPGNRGSHATLVDLRQKALSLSLMLSQEAQYVMTTAGIAAGTDMNALQAILVTSGFSLADVQTPQGVLEKVQNLHVSQSRDLNNNQVKLVWRRPLNVTARGNVKGYRVLRNTSADVNTAIEVAITTRTRFIDENSGEATAVWTYWVIPFNSAGPGVISDPITVPVLGI